MKIKVLFFAISLSFFACTGGNTGSGEGDDAANTVELPTTIEGIQALAATVYNETTKKIDPQKAMNYVQACENFASANPTDPKSPEILLKAAETARNVNQHDRAIAIYDTVLEKFSAYPKSPQALFLKAFTLDDNMNNKDAAKVLYEEFIEKYPTDDFAESAKFMLENLYKTDAEIIQEFEKKRKEGVQ